MGGHDRLEIGKIRVGGSECGRLWLDDLSHRDRVRRTDSKEPVHDPREVDFSVPPEKRAAPHLASERATRADALDRGADRIARDAIFIREMTLVRKTKALAPLARLDPLPQRHLDVCRHAFRHRFAFVDHFWAT